MFLDGQSFFMFPLQKVTIHCHSYPIVNSGMYKVEYSFPPAGRGIKMKGFDNEEDTQSKCHKIEGKRKKSEVRCLN